MRFFIGHFIKHKKGRAQAGCSSFLVEMSCLLLSSGCLEVGLMASQLVKPAATDATK